MSLRVTFLGTSGAVPTPQRNPISLHVRREGDAFLFDVGEGTQRQMMRYTTGFDLEAIFLTHYHGDHYFGLPGLLETLDFTDRTAPLAIYVPHQHVNRIRTLLDLTVGETGFAIVVHPIAPGDTVFDRDEYVIQAIAADHDTPAVGYLLAERERPGRFDKRRALELGVPEGPLFGRLQRGESVTLSDGSTVEPDEVLGPPRPGRTLVYTGDTRPLDRTANIASGCDLLVHEATFGDADKARAKETGHSTARQAGRIAAAAGAHRLALVHVSSRYAAHFDDLRREAADVYGGELLVPNDGTAIDIPLRDA